MGRIYLIQASNGHDGEVSKYYFKNKAMTSNFLTVWGLGWIVFRKCHNELIATAFPRGLGELKAN